MGFGWGGKVVNFIDTGLALELPCLDCSKVKLSVYGVVMRENELVLRFHYVFCNNVILSFA